MTRFATWLLARSTAFVLTVSAFVIVVALATAVVAGTRQASDNHRLLEQGIRQNARQEQVLLDSTRIMCDSALGTLTILKAIRNQGRQAGRDVSGIPNQLPPNVEQICARYSQRP